MVVVIRGYHGSSSISHGPYGASQGPLDTYQGPLDTYQGPLDTYQGPLDTSQGPLDTHQESSSIHPSRDNSAIPVPPFPLWQPLSPFPLWQCLKFTQWWTVGKGFQWLYSARNTWRIVFIVNYIFIFISCYLPVSLVMFPTYHFILCTVSANVIS